MAKCHNQSLEEIDDLKRMAVARINQMEKDAVEILKLKEKAKEPEAELTKTRADHSKELDEFLSNTKRDATIAIFEAKTKMADEAIAAGIDASIWDLQTWRDRLASLKGEDLESEQDVAYGKAIVIAEVVMQEGDDGCSFGEEGKLD